jgi:tetratricopeptide (TPR) repeat protein
MTARRGAQSVDTQARTNATVAGVILGLVFTGVGMLLGTLRGSTGIALLGTGLAAGVLAGLAVRWLALNVARGFAGAIAAFLVPTGASVPYEPTFSAHDALEASGDVAGAIAAYEATLVADPGNLRALRQAAELHARASNPARAAALLGELRRAAGDARDAELYATQRLADLYLGALGDDGRALVELRRIVERFPGTRESDGAREALQRLKRESAPDPER